MKHRLFSLVAKGKEEGFRATAHRNKSRALIEKAKVDQEMNSKAFLQEARESINVQLERPQVDPIAP